MSCDVHGKILHRTRRAAKRVARLDSDRLSVYVCGIFPGYHCGHLPPAVKKGDLDRRIFRRTR